MNSFVARIEFELPDSNEIDAASAAAMLGERLFAESIEFRIKRLEVVEQ